MVPAGAVDGVGRLELEAHACIFDHLSPAESRTGDILGRHVNTRRGIALAMVRTIICDRYVADVTHREVVGVVEVIEEIGLVKVIESMRIIEVIESDGRRNDFNPKTDFLHPALNKKITFSISRKAGPVITKNITFSIPRATHGVEQKYNLLNPTKNSTRH